MARRQWVCVFASVLALVAQPVAPRAQQQTPGASVGDRCPHGNRGWRVGAVSERGQRSSHRASARLRRNIAHVAAIDTAPGGDAHRDCTRSARDRRIRDSVRRPGHGTRRRPHACAREKPRCEQSGRRRTRHRIDGRLRVRRAVPRARSTGSCSWTRFCPASRAGRRSTTIRRSGTSASTGPRRRPLFAVVSGRTSSTSGTTSPLIRHDRFPRPIARPTPLRMPVRGGCAPAWAYFVSFQQAARDFARLSQTKLTMPVLSIGGEKANGAALAQQVQLVATNARSVTLPNTGHWVMEESPQATMDALVAFLNPSAATPTASSASAQPMSQASASTLPQMRLTPDEVRANQTGTEQSRKLVPRRREHESPRRRSVKAWLLHDHPVCAGEHHDSGSFAPRRPDGDRRVGHVAIRVRRSIR